MQYTEILFDYKKEVLIHAVTRVNLENTVVSERSQEHDYSQKLDGAEYAVSDSDAEMTDADYITS